MCWAQAAYWSGTFAGLVLAYGVVLSCSLEITKELVCIYCQEKTTGFTNQENNVRATSYSPSEWEVRLRMQATSYSPSGDCESMQARTSANSVDFQERCQCTIHYPRPSLSGDEGATSRDRRRPASYSWWPANLLHPRIQILDGRLKQLDLVLQFGNRSIMLSFGHVVCIHPLDSNVVIRDL